MNKYKELYLRELEDTEIQYNEDKLMGIMKEHRWQEISVYAKDGSSKRFVKHEEGRGWCNPDTKECISEKDMITHLSHGHTLYNDVIFVCDLHKCYERTSGVTHKTDEPVYHFVTMVYDWNDVKCDEVLANNNVLTAESVLRLSVELPLLLEKKKYRTSKIDLACTEKIKLFSSIIERLMADREYVTKIIDQELKRRNTNS